MTLNAHKELPTARLQMEATSPKTLRSWIGVTSKLANDVASPLDGLEPTFTPVAEDLVEVPEFQDAYQRLLGQAKGSKTETLSTMKTIFTDRLGRRPSRDETDQLTHLANTHVQAKAAVGALKLLLA